jgi:membrane protein DedA with SNARE-associated domain
MAAEKGPTFGELPSTNAINRFKFGRRDRASEGMRRGGFKALGLGLSILLGGALAFPLIPATAVAMTAYGAAIAAGKFFSIVGGATGVIGAASESINDHRSY